MLNIILRPELATMVFDRPANGKAHAEPGALGSVERLENLAQTGRSSNRGHDLGPKFQPCRRHLLCSHFDIVFLRGPIPHRVKRIDQQIENNLL